MFMLVKVTLATITNSGFNLSVAYHNCVSQSCSSEYGCSRLSSSSSPQVTEKPRHLSFGVLPSPRALPASSACGWQLGKEQNASPPVQSSLGLGAVNSPSTCTAPGRTGQLPQHLLYGWETQFLAGQRLSGAQSL